eukprot:2107814-Prymnesium_polylepis.1
MPIVGSSCSWNSLSAYRTSSAVLPTAWSPIIISCQRAAPTWRRCRSWVRRRGCAAVRARPMRRGGTARARRLSRHRGKQARPEELHFQAAGPFRRSGWEGWCWDAASFRRLRPLRVA